MCILLLLCLCTPNLLLNLPPFSRMLYIFLHVSKSMYLFLLYMFLCILFPSRAMPSNAFPRFISPIPSAIAIVCVFGMFPCLCLLPGARGTHRTHALHLETRFRVPLPLAPSHLVIRFRMQPSPFFPLHFFFFSSPFCHFLPKLYLSHFLMFQV